MIDAEDVMGWALGLMVALLGTALAVFLIAMCADGIQAYRAEPASIACEARQMAPRRRTFSTDVQCVPVPMRRDTLAIQQVTP
jgi:hypothetical protein